MAVLGSSIFKGSGGLESIVQTVKAETGAVATGTTTMPSDDTIPQSTEGDEYLAATITPTNANNYLNVRVVLNWACSSAVAVTAALFKDPGANPSAVMCHGQTTASNALKQSVLDYRVLAGSTASTTFKVRIGPSSAATITLNGVTAARRYGGVQISSITITETTI